MLVPKLLTTLRGYTRAQFAADVTAGFVVGIVALPLAIAFAIASGVTPDRGLYTGRPKVLVIVMKNVPAIDSTGLSALRDVVGRFRRTGTRVLLAGVHAQPMMALQRSALADEIPESDLAGGLDDTLAIAKAHVESS
jgi:MFS superfamily sulfate permease-like transporter